MAQKLSVAEQARARAQFEELIITEGLELTPAFWGVSRDAAITRFLVARKYDVDGAFKARERMECPRKHSGHCFNNGAVQRVVALFL